jgi:PAS domain S-box-containing protein
MQTTKGLTLRYVFALGLIAILSLTAYYRLIKIIEAGKTSAAVINISGRQRMLSQRIAHFAGLYVDSNYDLSRDEILVPLLDAVNLMEKSHNGLVQGDPKMHLPGNLSPKVRSIYFDPPLQLDEQVRKYILEVRSLVNTQEIGFGKSSPHYLYVSSASRSKLLDSLNAVVSQYQFESEMGVAELLNLEMAMLAAILLLLFIIGMFIFRPMVRKIVQDQHKLINAEQQTRDIIKTVGEGVVTVDQSSSILLVNHELCNIFGYSEEELIKEKVEVIIPEKYRTDFAVGFKRYLNGGASSIIGKLVEFEGVRKDGSIFPLEVRVEESKLKENGERYFTASIRNISERKIAEYSLRKSNNAIEHALEMIIITDPNAAIEYVNPSFESITGYSKEGVIGQSLCDLKSNPGSEDFIQNMRQAIKSGKPWQGTLLSKKKNGSFYDEEMSISPVVDGEGILANFVAISRDVSKEKKLMRNLIQSEKLSSIGTFASGMAHEINNPLTAILGFAERIIKKKNPPPEIRKNLQTIAEQAERAVGIVKNLLKYSRNQEQGKVPVDINVIAEEVLALQAHRFHTDNIEVKMNLKADLPKVFENLGQLHQVFMSIILNAHYEMKEANGKGLITVTTGFTNKEVLISFENDGPPIPEEKLGEIFDPFYTTKGPDEATGLGMYVSHGIIQDHGGRIWAENLGDSGVRFNIALPEIT